MTDNNKWWQGAVFYQIYPRSFQDTSGNGIGDLPGIIDRLDYIASLNVDAIWISPFFKSPMKDYGYDVQDYRDVDPLFGTIDDFKTLLAEAHKRGIKIMIDLVLSHTSAQHEWFIDSRMNKDGDKKDFYVWADPKPDGSPPNNWLSIFGGAAWSYDFYREQYYLHNFLPSQPDLNVHHPEVQNALLAETKFWLDFGVDGLRLDVINFCCHDTQLRDNPAREDDSLSSQLTFRDPYGMQLHIYDKSRPETIDFVKRLRALTDQYENIVTLGEIGDDNPLERMAEYSSGNDKLHTCYSFGLVTIKPHSAAEIKNAVTSFIGDGWPSWAFSNHDLIRAVSRWTEKCPHLRAEAAKMLIALLTTLRGTPFIYQGEELGLPEATITKDQIQDPWGKFLYPKWSGRDGCRTPIPWNKDETNAGFSNAAQPWLPVDKDHSPLSVSAQENDPHSVLNFTRSFLKWRKDQPALTQGGAINFIDDENDHILIFERRSEDQTMRLRFNLSPNECGNLGAFEFETSD